MALFMEGEAFARFMETFGEPTRFIPHDEAVVERLRGVLPDVLFDWWRHFGWSGFLNGRHWITNPLEYEDVCAACIRGTALEPLGKHHVLSRSAFGDLEIYHPVHGRTAQLCPMDGTYHSYLPCIQHTRQTHPDAIEGEIASALGYYHEPEEIDQVDVETDTLVFEAAVRELGVVEPDEMYAFVPCAPMGGIHRFANLRIEKTIPYLQRIADLGGTLREA
jgi:hypothetical protein